MNNNLGFNMIYVVTELDDLVVQIPADQDRVWVEAATVLEGPGSITVYADDVAVSRTQRIGKTAERVTDSGWLRAAPGSEVRLRMKIDGVWSASPEWPTKLSVATVPPPQPGQAEVWELLRSTLYNEGDPS